MLLPNSDASYLQPTYFIDCDSDIILHTARQLTTDSPDPFTRAARLFYFVRDEIRYDLFAPKALPRDFRASATLVRGSGYCVQKAVLLVALARAAAVPARVAFAMIRNNAVPSDLLKIMQTNVFPWHGYAQLRPGRKWVKVTPTFDRRLCEVHGLQTVEFDGRHDARFHRYDRDGKVHIEYLFDRGPFHDVPLEPIQKALRQRGLVA